MSSLNPRLSSHTTTINVIRQIIICAGLALSALGVTPVENVGVTPLAPNNTVTVGGLNSMETNAPVTSRLDASGRRQVFWTYITPAASDPPGSGAVTTSELVVRHISHTGAIAEYKLRNPNNASLTYKITDDPYHVAPSVGIDQNGYIHVVANMHYHGWQYWRSANAYNVAGGFVWKGCVLSATPEPNITGAPSVNSPPGYMISYPYFFNDKEGRLYVAYRQRLTSSWGAGCVGGAVAQYVVSSQRWLAVGGTDYTLPNGMLPWNGIKAPTLIYHTDGSTDIPAYQGYNISVAFDAWNQMHLATTLWSAAGGVQANGPTHVVYLRGMPGTLNADGSRIWNFVRPDATSIPNANLPAQLITAPGLIKELWPVYTRPAANKLQFTAKCGVGYQPGTPGSPRPIVRYNESLPGGSFVGVSRHFYVINNSYQWYLMNNVSPQGGYFFGQANAGGGFVTTFTVYSNGTTIYRTNDNGATKQTYVLNSGSSGMRLDYSYAMSYQNAVTGQRILIQHTNPGLNASVPSSSASATLEVLDFQ